MAEIGIIGAGNMGGAIARGIIDAGLFQAQEILVCDVISEKADYLARDIGAGSIGRALEVVEKASYAIIAVKPQTMKDCLDEIAVAVDASKLIISIAAGITTDFIESNFGEGARVVRVMPNTPALVGAGAAAICAGKNAGAGDLDKAEEIFSALGEVYRFDESLIDAVTAVSGSGPAYLFLFAECLQRAAVEAGLPADKAPKLVAQTLFGSAKLLVESEDSASTLRANVTSPGGTTEAALAVLNERGFEDTIVAAVKRALERAGELGGVKKN